MEIQEVNLDEIEMDFQRFRIIDPLADARMIQSMTTHGQLSPLFAGRAEKHPILIDGFKRYRAARTLKKTKLLLHCIDRPTTTLKAIALTMHTEESPVSEIEKALLLHSMHYEDKMKQENIALLCNRHKSWVCRRIALIDRLSEDVKQQLHLGLLSVSIARELVRLPRGNQSQVLECIQSNKLNSRQTTALIEHYMQQQPWQQQRLLAAPFKVIDPHALRSDCGMFTAVVAGLMACSNRMTSMITEHGIGSLNREQRYRLNRAMERVNIQCGAVITMATRE